MSNFLQNLYETHHATGARAGFSIHEKVRGEYFKSIIGTKKSVLDLGCRDGTLTAHYLKGNTVTGVDVDNNLLKIAAKKGIKTKHLDLYQDWNLKQKFDVVVAGEVLEHLYHPEEIIKKASQVLKPRGKFLVSVPNAYIISARSRFLVGQEIPAHFDPTHINLFSKSKLERLLSNHFKKIEITGFAPPIYKPFLPLSVSLFADDLVAVAIK
jgi:2-polyprenyl-3-methyl-5-hydroxy-6-metoxy-1,4-benzoquinol methylase